MRTSAYATITAVLALATSVAADPADFPEFSAGAENRLGLTFSPDGQHAFWAEWDGKWGSEPGQRIIYMSTKTANDWGHPEPAPFTNEHSDDDPFVSPDGRWLYFVSDRPTDGSEGNADIWRYDLAEGGNPERLSINSPEAEYSPVVTNSGALYFASARDGGRGQGDLYRADPVGDGFGEPVALGAGINSHHGEWNLWVSADEQEIIFESSSRPTNVSVPGDLYYTWQTAAGWAMPVSMQSLNTSGSELMPRLHPDGLTLFYGTAPIGGHARTDSIGWPEYREQLRASYAPTLIVANRSSHEVKFVDLTSGDIEASVPTGDGPHLLSNVSEGRIVATGYGEFPRPHAEPVAQRPPFEESLNSRLTLIDTNEHSVMLDAVVQDCARPHASWIVDDKAYVTCEDEQQVREVDLDSGDVTRSFDARQQGSHVLGYVPAAGTLAVSNVDSGSVSLIKLESGDTAVVELANGSEGMLVVDNQVWVANGGAGSIAVVDVVTQVVLTLTERICSFPISLSRKDQLVWVACFGSAELVALDTEDYSEQRRIKLQSQPLHLLIHPSRPIAYTALPRANAVAEIDLDTGEEIRRITVGIEPDGLRWAQD